MLDYSLEHIFSYTASLSIEVIGPLPEGVRVNYYVTAGTVEGPKLNGKILPVGGDWNILRMDGVGILDVRATFETDDGALILTTYSGVYDLGKADTKSFCGRNYRQPFRFVWFRAITPPTPVMNGSTGSSAWELGK